MNKTRIEWADFTINPVKGLCPVACSYCYARRLYKRFKWNPEIRADWQETGKIPQKPSRIFVGSTIELFGDWVKPEWMKEIFNMVRRYPQHTFIFLTKRPENLIKWSPFPDNCWVGCSVTDVPMFHKAVHGLAFIKAPVKFMSFEPLLSPIDIDCHMLSGLLRSTTNWLIIGQQTPPSVKTSPKMSWIQDILVAANNAGNIPVFMKNNLKPLLKGQWAGWKLRQEFPK